MATRRSSGRKIIRKKYTVDAFEGIEELQSDPGSEGDENRLDAIDDDDDDVNDNDEFSAEPESPDQEEEEEDGVSDIDPGEARDDEDDDSDGNARDVDLDDGISIAEDMDEEVNDDDAVEGADAVGDQRRRPPKRNDDGEKLYTRGVEEGPLFRHSSKWRMKHFFGPTEEDRKLINRACAKWSREIACPTHRVRHGNIGGFEYSITYEAARKNADFNWKWYSVKGGKDIFQQKQTSQQLPADDTSAFSSYDGSGRRSIVVGPLKRQRLIHLAPGESIPLSQPFEDDHATRSQDYKPGFLLNLGARVKALDWVPNRHGRDQYLAVSLMPEKDGEASQEDSSYAPAFSPSQSYPSSIQIWHFAATAKNRIDKDLAPSQALVLCVKIGGVRALKWCPVPGGQLKGLGLLACLSTDGAVRVIDVDTPPTRSHTRHVAVEKFAFVSKPPNTVCTCITWLGSTRIAAGCANGFVAIWDLPQSLHSSAENPRPVIYAPISVTYILDIASCWPSFPHFIVTTSMAGYVALTDISKPRPGTPENTVTSIRNRIGQPVVLWNDHTQSVFSVDDGYIVRGYLFRRFFTTLGIARFRAMALTMATSLCHPFLLAGTADGEVFSCNPIVRIANGSKAPLWQQVWFKHEWRRPTPQDENLALEDEEDLARATVVQDGLTRFLEGFKVESVNLHSDGKSGPNIKDGSQYATVFEERTAVTAVAWNPNLHVGGWAAAGMADGLLRVEDIAL